MEFVPLRFLSKLSAGVPTPARSASVFFTTLYLPPAACTARRSLVSASTVMPWKVERMTVDTLASSVLSLSRSCCFSLRFFIVSLRWFARLRGSGHRFYFGQVDGDARTHGRSHGDFLDVLALGCGRLGFHHRLNYRLGVLGQLRAVKLNLADRAVHDPRLVDTEFHFAGLYFLDRLGHFEGDRTGLGVGHQPARAEHLTQLSGGAHHVRRGDHRVVIRPAFHDFLHDFVPADEVRPGFLRFANLVTAGNHQHANALAESVGQTHGAAHDLVGVFRINAQIDGQLDGFVEFRVMRLLQKFGRLSELIGAQFYQLTRFLHV